MNKNFKIVYYLILIILVTIFLINSFNIYKTIIKKDQVKVEAKVNDIVIKKKDIKYYQQKYNNQDIKGILKIDGLNINTLVVQTNDNEYYLNHLVNKQFNILGSVFIDYRTKLNNSKKIIIYGHSSNEYEIPFNNLHQLLQKHNFQKYKYLELQTNNETLKYELVSIKITNNNDHLKVNFEDNEWVEYLNSLTVDALYKNDIEIKENMEVLILQTCLLNENNQFLIINYRKI